MDSILSQFWVHVFQYGNGFQLVFGPSIRAGVLALARKSHRRDEELNVKDNWFRRTEDNRKT